MVGVGQIPYRNSCKVTNFPCRVHIFKYQQMQHNTLSQNKIVIEDDYWTMNPYNIRKPKTQAKAKHNRVQGKDTSNVY